MFHVVLDKDYAGLDVKIELQVQSVLQSKL
jgi:hypothetical protein